MLNSPDPQTKEDLKQKMESVSEQIDISKNDFMSATGNIKENLNNETERFQEDLKDLKDRVIDLSSKGINVARQTISTNLETVKGKASQLKHCALEKAGKSIQFTGNYIREKPYQSVGIAAGIGFLHENNNCQEGCFRDRQIEKHENYRKVYPAKDDGLSETSVN